MDSTALRDLFRSDVKDIALPTFWSDEEIWSYMDAAQKMFCRLQGGIADATSSVTKIAAVAGAPYAAVSPLILKIREAHLAADGRNVDILNFEDLQNSAAPSDYGFRAGYRIDNSTGPVRALVVGMESNKVRFLHVPDADQQIDLIVYRMPLEEIVDEGQTIEIDDQHHRYLLFWMKHLAHQKQDAETYDRGRSETFRAEFFTYCDQAKAEREKREHKYRSVAYGGY